MDEVTRLRHIVETQKLINSVSLDRDELMRVITERAQSITGADGGVVELVEGDEMVYSAVSGISSGSLGLRLKMAKSLSGRCVRLGMPLRCDDTEHDVRVDREACRRQSIRSLIVVPLLKGDSPVGVLKVSSKRPDAFDDTAMMTLQEMAEFITDSLAHASSHVRETHNALHDRLTGLPNRHLLVECLEQACMRAERDHTPLAVFMIDLDGFKRVNDDHGHAAGDDVLRRVARGLNSVVRGGDILARIGGDEFVLVCESASEHDAYRILDRLAAAVRVVAETTPEYSHIAASVGLAWKDAESRTPDELLAAADASMYRVKNAGLR